MTNPKPPSSATPATSARFPERSIFMAVILPPHRRAAPGEAGPERRQHQNVAALQASFAQRFVQGDRDGGGGRIPIALNVGVYLIVPQGELLLQHVNDAQVG